jgi:hypothetical protein
MRFHDDPKVPRFNHAELVSVTMEQVECPHAPFIIYLEFLIRDDFIAIELIDVLKIFSDGYPRREDRKLITAGN